MTTSLVTSYQINQTFSFPTTPRRNPRRLSLKSKHVDGDGIPNEDVKLLAKFKSRHNYIRVLQVSKRADHSLAGTRLHPNATLHAWELDPAVVSVARQYFGLARLEAEFSGRLHVHVGDALSGVSGRTYAGLAVDLFSKGSVLPELQEEGTWRRLARCLRKGGRVMANVGGGCVESEDSSRDGRVVMHDTLAAMARVFGEEKVFVLRLGDGSYRDESSVALTGELPDLDSWKEKLPKSFRGYVDMWRPFRGFSTAR